MSEIHKQVKGKIDGWNAVSNPFNPNSYVSKQGLRAVQIKKPRCKPG